ncbi:siphovirus Gp157 family protein [Peribacillus frigoritolerans]|uniref:siphovirus Gp157 family protein n=1 Tax=Peribacillus frigoritolerans TaxID=450367 RepID=UPI003632507E
MKLYELSQQYSQLMELVEELDAITFRDTLESIQEEIDDKVENTVKLMRSFQGDVEAIKSEEKRLAERRKAIENRIESIKDYLRNEMEIAGIDKVKRPTLTVSIANNPPSVEISDESLIPTDFMVPQPDRIDKKALLVALKEGEAIEGCSIKQTRSVRIR